MGGGHHRLAEREDDDDDDEGATVFGCYAAVTLCNCRRAGRSLLPYCVEEDPWDITLHMMSLHFSYLYMHMALLTAGLLCEGWEFLVLDMGIAR